MSMMLNLVCENFRKLWTIYIGFTFSKVIIIENTIYSWQRFPAVRFIGIIRKLLLQWQCRRFGRVETQNYWSNHNFTFYRNLFSAVNLHDEGKRSLMKVLKMWWENAKKNYEMLLISTTPYPRQQILLTIK